MKNVWIIVIILVLAVIVSGCSFDKTGAFAEELGEFEVMRNESISVLSGDYQLGFITAGAGYVSVFIAGATISGDSSLLVSNGEAWAVLQIDPASVGNIITVETEVLAHTYYATTGPTIDTYVLLIEVK